MDAIIKITFYLKAPKGGDYSRGEGRGVMKFYSALDVIRAIIV